MWYTSGIESFISTMETSSLMGMNVARLIADGWKQERTEREALDESMSGKVGGDEMEKSVIEGMEVEEVGNKGPMEQVPMAGKATGQEL